MMMMSKEDVREKRRNIFLNKLKNAREQSRVQARGGEDEVCTSTLYPYYHCVLQGNYSNLVDDAFDSSIRTQAMAGPFG